MNFQFWSALFSVVFVFVLFWNFQCFFFKWKKWKEFKSKMEKLPGSKATRFYFLLGNVLEFAGPRKAIFQNVKTFINSFADHSIVTFWTAFAVQTFLIKAEAAEALLNNTNNLDKSSSYKYTHKWLGSGLLTSSGQKWHPRRKMLTPSFHFEILEDFIEVFNEQAQILTMKLQEHVGKESFDVYPYISLCTLDIICETVMSKSVNAQDNKESEYVKAVNKLTELISIRALKPWLRWDWFYYNISSLGRLEKKNLRILHEFTNAVIAERKQERKSLSLKTRKKEEIFGKKKRFAFLDNLLEYFEDGKSLSQESIREEVDTFMFAGHDTTASGINWALFLLGHNPDVQQKVLQELETIFGDDFDRFVTASDLTEMKYLECVIKEALRIYPPVPSFGRTLKNDLKFHDYEVPAGSNAMLFPYFIHRDPRYFPDPEKFDPDRFLPENSLKRHPYSYIPFSAGARNCIGQKFALMEEKIVICHLIRKFKVTSMQNREELKLLSEIVLRPANGSWIQLESIKSSSNIKY